MKRAALYLRVSTLDQHPESQLHDLRGLAAQRGFEIVEEYTDKISGVKARRRGLDQLMSDARRGQFDVVLVWSFDRLARSVRHLLEVLDELNHLAIEFISFRENIDTGGPLGRVMVIIVGAIAELERNLIIERVRRMPAHASGVPPLLRCATGPQVEPRAGCRAPRLSSGATAAAGCSCYAPELS